MIIVEPTYEDLQVQIRYMISVQKDLEKEILRLRAMGHTESWTEGYQAGKDSGYILALFDVKVHKGEHELTECRICAAPYFLPEQEN